jgi:hypothetical protein
VSYEEVTGDKEMKSKKLCDYYRNQIPRKITVEKLSIF